MLIFIKQMDTLILLFVQFDLKFSWLTTYIMSFVFYESAASYFFFQNS